MEGDSDREWRPQSHGRTQPNDNHFYMVTQNARGLSSDKEEEMAALMVKWGIFLACVQETWREGSEFSETADHMFVHTNAARVASRGRASGGLAIVLSNSARQAWRRAGEPVVRIGGDPRKGQCCRVMGIKLRIGELAGKDFEMVVICAYAPTSAEKASTQEIFLDDLAQCLDSECLRASPGAQKMVLIGGDFNASLGMRSDAIPPEVNKLLGPWGLRRDSSRCDSGQALLDFMATRDMRAPASFFQKQLLFSKAALCHLAPPTLQRRLPAGPLACTLRPV